MIYRDENGFKLMPYKVTYTQNGETQENYASEKTTWQGYEKLGHIKDLSFKEVKYSKEQLTRLGEVRDFPETEYPYIESYVLEGYVDEGSQLFAKKRVADLEAALVELADMVLGGLS